MKNNLLKTIGNTPLVQLTNIAPSSINLYAKLEGQNPGGSVKDRAALNMIEQAEKRGDLTTKKTIIEATSGNMGIALAMIAVQKGYKIKIFMSEGMSVERRKMMKAFGAELVLTDKTNGTQGAIKQAKSFVQRIPNKYWFADQFNNPDNASSYYKYMGPELLKQLPRIDLLIAGIGTSGTITGLAKYFKKHSPKTKIIGVNAEKGYGIQGIQNPHQDFHGELYENELLDEEIEVSTKNAYATTRRLAKEEGLFAGMSSGAAIYAALKQKKGNVVVIIPDRGEKYLSTELFE